MSTDKDTTSVREHADDLEQQQAYQAVLDYLVATGAYDDQDKADYEAGERVKFCEEIDLYADNEQLKNASIYEKKRQVLIHANDLYDIIAENNGNLPIPSHINKPQTPAAEDDATDESVTEHEISETIAIVPEPPEMTLSESEPISETEVTAHGKQNPLLRIVLNLGASAIITGALLVSITVLFNSEQQLQIIEYNFYLLASLTFLFVTLLEVHDKSLMRVRNWSGHILFIANANISGLLLMQPPWSKSAFAVEDGVHGLVINSIIEDLYTIGPYRLGVFFAGMALLAFIANHAAGVPKK